MSFFSAKLSFLSATRSSGCRSSGFWCILLEFILSHVLWMFGSFDLLHMVCWCLWFLHDSACSVLFLQCCFCWLLACFSIMTLLCLFHMPSLHFLLTLWLLWLLASSISDVFAFVAFWLAVEFWCLCFHWNWLALLYCILGVLRLRSRGGFLWFSGVVNLSLLVVFRCCRCCRWWCFACSPLPREFAVGERAGWVFLLEVSMWWNGDEKREVKKQRRNKMSKV